MKKYCCDYMNYYVNFMCDIYSDLFDCSDNFILFDKINKVYGLIIYDGGLFIIGILFCLWCGVKL